MRLFVGISLVYGQINRFFCPAQDVGKVLVVAGKPGIDVHHKNDDITFIQSQLHLIPDGLLKNILRTDHISAGIYQGEKLSVPFRKSVMPVTGDTGLIVHDGFAGSDQTVEKGRFAHIGPAHNGHDIVHNCYAFRVSSLSKSPQR